MPDGFTDGGRAPTLADRLRGDATLLRMMASGETRLSREDVLRVAVRLGAMARALDFGADAVHGLGGARP